MFSLCGVLDRQYEAILMSSLGNVGKSCIAKGFRLLASGVWRLGMLMTRNLKDPRIDCVQGGRVLGLETAVFPCEFGLHIYSVRGDGFKSTNLM